VAPTGTTAAPAATPTAAENTFATESDALRFTPYYTMFDTGLPDEDDPDEFVILRPFVPFSTGDERTELQAYMTASSDPETYGQLTTYIVDAPLPDGPIRVSANAESSPEISQRISLDNQGEGGSEVRFGDLQLIPVADGLIYIRPYYVSVPQNSAEVDSVTELRFVIVSYNDRSVLEPTIGEALERLFPGFDADVGDRLPPEAGDEIVETEDGTSTDTDAGDTTDTEAEATDTTVDSSVPLSGDATELLLQAEQLFIEADEALVAGELGTYQEKVQQAQTLVAEAVSILEDG
jgi:uncharacterized membrane protein (UPF0182 family)